ncbi:MAG: hypothetical protein ACXVUE_17615 [Solirubrobacteraceae bacterium]
MDAADRALRDTVPTVDACFARSFALSMQSENIGTATSAAIAGWQGGAQTAFSDYAGHVAKVVGANAEAFGHADLAMTALSREPRQLARPRASSITGEGWDRKPRSPTPEHPAYHTPGPDEQYCYRRAHISIDDARSVRWLRKTM